MFAGRPVPSAVRRHARRSGALRAASATSWSKSKLRSSIKVPAKSKSSFRDGWSRKAVFSLQWRSARERRFRNIFDGDVLMRVVASIGRRTGEPRRARRGAPGSSGHQCVLRSHLTCLCRYRPADRCQQAFGPCAAGSAGLRGNLGVTAHERSGGSCGEKASRSPAAPSSG